MDNQQTPVMSDAQYFATSVFVLACAVLFPTWGIGLVLWKLSPVLFYLAVGLVFWPGSWLILHCGLGETEPKFAVGFGSIQALLIVGVLGWWPAWILMIAFFVSTGRMIWANWDALDDTLSNSPFRWVQTLGRWISTPRREIEASFQRDVVHLQD